jgi:hypothetical protein
MRVVINEFELVPARGQAEAGEPVSGAALAASEETRPAAAPRAPVQDVKRIVRRQHERMLRVTAY